MFNVNPTNSTQIANSVQRDYRQAAANYRLAKATHHNPQDNNTVFKVIAILGAIITALIAIGQVVAI